MYYIRDNPPEERKPLFARETIVVEYQPPDVGRGRRLRPAEIGVLMDEQADTLDVSATIVDLAVRGYLQIKEEQKAESSACSRVRTTNWYAKIANRRSGRSLDGLLPYETRLKDALFEAATSVKLSDLKNKFHEDLAKVKSDLYEETAHVLRLFPSSPDTVRHIYQAVGIGTAVAGGLLAAFLGSAFGGALIGIPFVAGGFSLALLSPTMPRRTAPGSALYRRCLGFRLYMTTAERSVRRSRRGPISSRSTCRMQSSMGASRTGRRLSKGWDWRGARLVGTSGATFLRPRSSRRACAISLRVSRA